jgi:hypothetical protein
VLIALALAGCATSSNQAPPPDKIAVTYISWGIVRARWSVEHQSDGYSASRGEQVFPITAQEFANVAELLEPASHYAGRAIPCRRIDATDQPYGSIVWTRAGVDTTVTWNAGCVPKRNDVSLDNLDTARQAVQAMQQRAGTPPQPQ